MRLHPVTLTCSADPGGEDPGTRRADSHNTERALDAGLAPDAQTFGPAQPGQTWFGGHDLP